MALPIPSFSSFSYVWTYDVFLNFRGEDTRSGFTGYLYRALCETGIRTFIDDEELTKGEKITPALLKAIEQSRMAIVVFSINYASSTYCLQELVKILECIQGKGRWVWPIFYEVDPSDVRHQKGSYGEALAKHEERFKDKRSKVQNWRMALQEAADLSGWHYKHGYEYEFIQKIIDKISRKFNCRPLHVANYPVGLEWTVQEIISLLDVGSNEGVTMIGIYGIGGIGKTTITCAVYNSIADQFEDLCFLADIRENSTKHGLVKLQERLLLDLAGEKNLEFDTFRKGIPIIKKKLRGKKVLLILDDVNELEQLQAIAGGLDWFGSGSKIIITTRNKHLLDIHGVKKKYAMSVLNHQEALELFCWNAFKTNEILDSSYKEATNGAVLYCNGLPLALEIIGSNLFGRSLDQWKSALDTIEEIPNKSIQKILRLSFEGLEEKEQIIFLDMACFFVGHNLKEVTNILSSGRGFSPEYSIQVLIDKCLINIDKSCCVSMHDLIKEMGREIVRQESPLKLGERSRLWFYEDIRCVFENDMGTENVEVIMLQLPKNKKVQWKGNELKKMTNLRMLLISENSCFSTLPKHLPKSLRVLKWPRYPAQCLPSNFDPQNLVMLDISNSRLRLDKSIMKFESLNCLNLRNCECLKQIPNISGAPNLRKLYLDCCMNLVGIHDSVGFLDKLELLSARGCNKLRILPHCFNLTSLRTLYLGGCSSLQSFPEISGEMKNVTDIDLQGCGIEELPFSFSNLVGLYFLQLDGCNKLYGLPSSIFLLPNLRELSAISCKGFENFRSFGKGEEQERVGSLMSSDLRRIELHGSHLTDRLLASYLPRFLKVQTLSLTCTKITILPAEINRCHFLCVLRVSGSMQLREIRGLPPNIKYFQALDCTSLTCQAQSTLLSEAIHKNGDTYFVLPGSRIPGWFDYTRRGPYLSFWFRKKFPAIALCFVFGSTKKQGDYMLGFRICINGSEISYGKCCELKLGVTDHIILSDMQFLVLDDKLQRLYVEEEWNHVEVSYDNLKTNMEGIMKWMGVHVYKEKTSMRDVRFTNASPSNHRFWDFSNDLNLNWYQLQEKNRASQGMETCKAPDIQLQLHSYSHWLESPQQTCDDLQNYNLDWDLNCYSFDKIHKGKETNMYIENWYPYWDMYPALWQKQFLKMEQLVHREKVSRSLRKAIRRIEAAKEVKNLLLTICQRCLTSYEYLFKRKLVDSPICPICDLEPETVEHVFLFCPWTRPLWFASDFQWSINVNSVQSFQGWLLKKLRENKKVHQNANKMLALVGNICWAIWKARNEFVLEDQSLDPWRVFINLCYS